jgi:chromosome segregation ATPase
MPHSLRHLVGILAVIVSLAIVTAAQESAQERAAKLRAQLAETQARQAELQLRLQQLEEDLKPENIERSLAGVGSTHPEDLREARRRRLEIEQRGVQSQLDVLATSCTRLEAAIARAEAESYQQNSGIDPSATPARTISATTVNKTTDRARKHRVKRRRPAEHPPA